MAITHAWATRSCARPVVDAFRKESLLFTQFHVSPRCSPCRAALMSGRHEFNNGVTHTILERERMSLIAEARALNTKGKHIIPIIDDAHLLPIEALRKLRLLLEDFPRNHILILIEPQIQP